MVSMNEVDRGTVDNTRALKMTQEDCMSDENVNSVQHHANVLVSMCRETNPSKILF